MLAVYLLALVSFQAAFAYNRNAAGGFYTYAADDPVYTKIALEEHVTSASLLAAALGTCPDDACKAQLGGALLDYSVNRIPLMDANGVDFAILAMSSPGAQGVANATTAQALAVSLNNELARNISAYPNRLGGFAALAMHDPVWAANELNRTVTNLGFFGALINDFQTAGNGSTLLFYDVPAYDVFWQMAVDLNVPIYIHPRTPSAAELASVWATHSNLTGAPWQFAEGVARHTLGLCLNGVFDRFPALKIIIGHLGERIPYDLQRTDYLMERFGRRGVAKYNFRQYFETNIFITTSGHFSTPSLTLAMGAIGYDRIMYSVDYPYDFYEDATGWFDNLEIAHHMKEAMAYNTAANIFGLNHSLVGVDGTRTFTMKF